jgi:trimeric autotransporter adhesin
MASPRSRKKTPTKTASGQAGELFTFNSLNIASINVSQTANSQLLLPASNRIADLGTYTRTDGTTGTTGDVAQLGDVDLAADVFHRQFADQIPLAAGVTALPNMQGSGLVRDLWEVASQSPTLRHLLTQYAQTGARAPLRSSTWRMSACSRQQA